MATTRICYKVETPHQKQLKTMPKKESTHHTKRKIFFFQDKEEDFYRHHYMAHQLACINRMTPCRRRDFRVQDRGVAERQGEKWPGKCR